MLPDKGDLTFDQIQALKSSINESNLNNNAKTLIKGLIDFNGWLQQQLLEKKMSINRLKIVIFGEPQGKSKQQKGKANSNGTKKQTSTNTSNHENGDSKCKSRYKDKQNQNWQQGRLG